MKKTNASEMTEGPFFKKILHFAIPVTLTGLLQIVYNTADTAVVGRFAGKTALAAVGSTGSMIGLIVNLFTGLAMGAGVLTARMLGAKDKEGVRRSVQTAMGLSVLSGLLISVIGILLSPTLLKWMQAPADTIDLSTLYVRIYFLGAPGAMVFNFGAAIIRSTGDTRRPLQYLAISGFLNIALNLFTIVVLHWGVAGVAIATIASQAISMMLALWYLAKGGFDFRFRAANFRLPGDLVWKYLKIGFPIAVQGILISLSFLFIVSIVNAMGGENSAFAAGYGIVNRINGFAMLPAGSFAMAMAAITAQNIGANKPVRALRTLYFAIACTLTAGIVFLVILQLWPERMIALFIDPEGEGAQDVIRHGALYARSFSWDYVMVPIVFCTNGFFNGCGRTFFSMSNNLAGTFLIRVPASYFFSLLSGATLYHVGFAAPLASLLSNTVAIIYLVSGRWKPRRPR